MIATDPPGAGYDTMRWQLGGTEIAADCPFSEHQGLDRLFMVVEGKGVELKSIDDHGATRTTPVYPLRLPYAFRGDWKTDCRLLDGPVKVFNVIARRGKARASVEFVQGGTLSKAAGEIAFAVHLASLEAWMLAGPQSESAAIQPPPGPVALIRIAS
jgi:environmental stress-induced protein Ves